MLMILLVKYRHADARGRPMQKRARENAAWSEILMHQCQSDGLRPMTPVWMALPWAVLSWTILIMPVAAGKDAPCPLEPTPFQAEYNARLTGLPLKVRGIRSLQRNQDGEWIFRSVARALLARVEETSVLQQGRSRLRPLRYRYQRRGLGSRRTEQVDYRLDDDTPVAVIHRNRQRREQPVSRHVHDKLGYQLQLQLDLRDRHLCESSNDLRYLVHDGMRLRDYVFVVDGEETLDTRIGRLRTVRLVREGERDRSTTLWFAADHDYLLVRFVQIEDDGDSFRLDIRAATPPAVVPGISRTNPSQKPARPDQTGRQPAEATTDRPASDRQPPSDAAPTMPATGLH